MQQLARYGLDVVTALASRRGLTISAAHPGANHDLIIAGRRVDVKAAQPVSHSIKRGEYRRWQFWLKSSRRAVMSVYDYAADHSRDTEVVMFVCMPDVPYIAEIYLFEVADVPKTLTFGNRNPYTRHQDAWHLL